MLHLVDGTSQDVAKSYKDIRNELELYDTKLAAKPEVVALSKIDALTDEEIASKKHALEQASGQKVFVISSVACQGVYECLSAINRYITRSGRKKEDQTPITEPVSATDQPWSPI